MKLLFIIFPSLIQADLISRAGMWHAYHWSPQ